MVGLITMVMQQHASGYQLEKEKKKTKKQLYCSISHFGKAALQNQDQK